MAIKLMFYHVASSVGGSVLVGGVCVAFMEYLDERADVCESQ